MRQYHAVMIDETGCEFGAEVEANSLEEAYELLEEDYPESRVDQLEDDDDRRSREHSIYKRVSEEERW